MKEFISDRNAALIVTNFQEKKKPLEPANNLNISRPPPNSNGQFVTAKNQMLLNNNNQVDQNDVIKRFQPPTKGPNDNKQQKQKNENKSECHPRLVGIDDQLLERVLADILDQNSKPTYWTDISGLSHVRSQVVEIAIWPLENPELFQGIVAPGSGLLLFGPPGTGKTMIGKAIAHECKATFFSVKASTLTSKFVGEGEKSVKALFALAAIKQPSVIFFDEIDSLLCARSDKDNETSRQIKTEFMVQLDGASNSGNDKIVFIGATNRPQELDDAIKRRFQKKIYIPLPNQEGRREYFCNLIERERMDGKQIDLQKEEVEDLIRLTKGYSGADIRNLSREVQACMFPIREAARQFDIKSIKMENIRAAQYMDFIGALKIVKPTVDQKCLGNYLDWNNQYGSFNYDQQELDT